MKDLVKPILKIVSWMFGALVVSFTGVQTWLLLFEATGSPYIALLGLTFFEGGMLYWWVSFQYTAEGLGQLALSVIMAVLSLAVVSAAAALHLGAVSMTIFGANTVSRLITAAAIVNLIAKFAYPLVSPKMIGIIREKVVEGQLSKRIHEEVESKIADRQPEIVKRLSDTPCANWSAISSTHIFATRQTRPSQRQCFAPTPTPSTPRNRCRSSPSLTSWRQNHRPRRRRSSPRLTMRFFLRPACCHR